MGIETERRQKIELKMPPMEELKGILLKKISEAANHQDNIESEFATLTPGEKEQLAAELEDSTTMAQR